MRNLQQSYTTFLGVLQSIETKTNFLKQIRKPKLSDIELITLAFMTEHHDIDSENNLFQHLPPIPAGRIERSVYNRRKRALAGKIKLLQSVLQRLSVNRKITTSLIQCLLKCANCLVLNAQKFANMKLKRHLIMAFMLLKIHIILAINSMLSAR